MDYDNPTFSFIDYMVVSPYIPLCCYLYYRVVRMIAPCSLAPLPYIQDPTLKPTLLPKNLSYKKKKR